MPRKYDSEQEELGDIFANIFHSFKDLHNVAPIQIIKKLDRKGIIFARKPRRRVSQKSAAYDKDGK